MSVIKIFKGGSLEWLTAFFFLSVFLFLKSISTFDLSTVQRGVDGKLDASPSLSNCDSEALRLRCKFMSSLKKKKKTHLNK